MDERTGELHTYSRRADELLFDGIYAPRDAPDWARDRASLWNHVEAFEKRKDAQLARSFDIALPHELTPEQGRYAIQDWVRENFTRKGLIADVAIHRPGAEGDERNIHAHVLVVMRRLDGQEFAATKERAASFGDRADELQALRESWERIGNRHLVRHGFEPTLDCRSFEDRGVDRVPGLHMGKAATALERDGVTTDRGDINRDIGAHNAGLRERAQQEIEARKAEADRMAARQLEAMERQYGEARGRKDDTRGPSEARQRPEPEAGREARRGATQAAQALPQPDATRELAATAATAVDRAAYEGLGKILLRGLASFIGWLADSIAPPPPPTRDQAERIARSAEEKQEARQQREAQEAAHEFLLREIERSRQSADQKPTAAELYGTPKPPAQERDNERERDRDYERER